MRIRCSDRESGNDLIEYFRRCGCVADRIGRDLLEVEPRLPLLPEAAQLEIEGLLRVWQKLHAHSGGSVDLLAPTSHGGIRGPKSPDDAH
jgi:hypothetical protein